MAAAVVAVTAAASAEAVASVAAALTVAFAVAGFAVAGFTVPLTAVAFVAAAFRMVAFAAVGSTIAASTIGSSSLVILGTRSFTIPIHTTGTIPIAIILAIILMVTDTAALATAASVAAAFAAVGDSYNEPVYQGSAGYTDQLVGQIQLCLARAGYYNGLIDGVSGNATRRAIVNMSYERAHSLPADGQIRGRLLTTMGLGLGTHRNIWIRRLVPLRSGALAILKQHFSVNPES
jgi:Putative peptidoglycan binding domain